MKRSFVWLMAVLAIFVLAGCSTSAGEIQITDAWARTAAAGDTSAVYLVIDNPTAVSDTLLSASTEAAEHVELHKSQMDEAGTMMMQPQESVPVPAGEKVELAPGGLHIMLIGLKQDLKAGDELKVTLEFQEAGSRQVTAAVRTP